jgi:hypothetical protein
MPVVAVEWDKLQGAPEVRGLEEMVVQEQVQPEVQVIQTQEAAVPPVVCPIPPPPPA